MRSTIPKPVDREEWLEARAPFIGASECAALVGEHPFLTVGELAARRLTGTRELENSAMRRGRHLESAIAGWYGDEHGLALLEPDELYVYGDLLVATLDRVVVGSSTIVEIKTVSHRVVAPERYWWWQAQCQLLCSGLERVDVVALDPSLELQVFPIEADDEAQARLVNKAAKLLDHLSRGEMPPEVDLTYTVATILHPEAVTPAVELDAQALGWCRQLAHLQRRIRELEADEDRLRGMIGHRLGEAAEGHHDGHLVVAWRAITRTGLDLKAIRAEQPDLARRYATSTTYRSLRLKDLER